VAKERRWAASKTSCCLRADVNSGFLRFNLQQSNGRGAGFLLRDSGHPRSGGVSKKAPGGGDHPDHQARGIGFRQDNLHP